MFWTHCINSNLEAFYFTYQRGDPSAIIAVKKESYFSARRASNILLAMLLSTQPFCHPQTIKSEQLRALVCCPEELKLFGRRDFLGKLERSKTLARRFIKNLAEYLPR